MVFEKKLPTNTSYLRILHNIHVITLVKQLIDLKLHFIMFIFTMSKDRISRISFENAIMVSKFIFIDRLVMIQLFFDEYISMSSVVN